MNTFLLSSLQHMGFKAQITSVPNAVGYGEDECECSKCPDYFWVVGADVQESEVEGALALLRKTHIAFTAKSTDEVDKFHEAALKAGAIDNGAAGEREKYHRGYYAAFVYDPVCGINIEVVHHGTSFLTA